MSADLVAYAAADVVHLHAMYHAWRHFMGQGNMDKTVWPPACWPARHYATRCL